jgi:hypothetical protein
MSPEKDRLERWVEIFRARGINAEIITQQTKPRIVVDYPSLGSKVQATRMFNKKKLHRLVGLTWRNKVSRILRALRRAMVNWQPRVK